MDCPKCDGSLQEETFGSVSVDRCNDCLGIWFDASEVRKLVAHAASGRVDVPDSPAPPSELDVTAGKCPRCKTGLQRVESLAVANLHYDQCMDCRGAWLDAGELAQIVDNPDASEEINFFNEFD